MIEKYQVTARHYREKGAIGAMQYRLNMFGVVQIIGFIALRLSL